MFKPRLHLNLSGSYIIDLTRYYCYRVVSIYWQGDDPFPWNLGSNWPTPSWRHRVL